MIVKHEPTLDLFRGPGYCQMCGKRSRRREPHHIRCRGMGGGSRLDIAINLISVCATFTGGDNCHDDATVGIHTADDCWRRVGQRECLDPDLIQDVINRLLRWPKDRLPPNDLLAYLPEGWLRKKGWLKGDAA